MQAKPQLSPEARRLSPLRELVRFLVLFAPACLLYGAGWLSDGSSGNYLKLGGVAAFALCLPRFTGRDRWLQPLLGTVIPVYLISFAVLWLSAAYVQDWYLHLVEGIFLFVPLALLAFLTLNNSQAMANRRAWRIIEKLSSRQDWPADLYRCRGLPEVKQLREALRHDAQPALHLLGHARPEVRLVALSALEGRRNWRPGQPEQVLHALTETVEPEVQATGIASLSLVEERYVVESLAGFLRSPSLAVRRAATESLLWDLKQRWAWLRPSIRMALADVDLVNDGPLHCHDPLLPPEAVDDLTAWAAAKGVLGIRAAETLGLHYRHVLDEQTDEALVRRLRKVVVDPQAAPALRIELAKILQGNGPWGMEMLERMLDSSNPAPLRLIAAEILLTNGNSRSAIKTLHDLANVPNREIALETAALVQSKLKVDLGVPADDDLPSVHTPEAIAITQRLQEWANSASQRALQWS